MRFVFDDDFDINREFPLGDGTADTSASSVCPYCGEAVSLSIDPGSGDTQEYVEDCEVCCQPWTVKVRYANDGTVRIRLTPLNS